MRLELLFADDLRRVRQASEAARARDRASQLEAHRKIRATIDAEVESMLAAAAAKRLAYEEDWVEEHRIRERVRSHEERLRADVSRAGPAALTARAGEPEAAEPEAPAHPAAPERELLSA